MESHHGAPDSYKQAIDSYYQQGLEVVPPQAKPQQHAYYQSQGGGYSTAGGAQGTILGMRRPTFFLSLALAVVIIVAAVGGGVGGSMAVENARKSACLSGADPAANSTPNSAATSTVTVTATPLSVPLTVVKSDCPGIQDEVAIGLGSDSWVFKPACGIDYNGGDFGAVIVYSFHDCLQACAAHNHFSGKDVCNAVSFKANQTAAVPTDYGNCWLKSGQLKTYSIPDGPTGTSDMSIGALLKGKTSSGKR
nr:hypothetical protein F5Y17DRAFT_469997 [Xylariaceae sp. FL0594]